MVAAHPAAVAAGSVLIVAIAVRMAPDGVTSQLQIVRLAQVPLIPPQVLQRVDDGINAELELGFANKT